MLKPLQDGGDTYILSAFSYNSADHASRDQDFRSQVNFLYPLESSLRLDFVKYIKLGLKNNIQSCLKEISYQVSIFIVLKLCQQQTFICVQLIFVRFTRASLSWTFLAANQSLLYSFWSDRTLSGRTEHFIVSDQISDNDKKFRLLGE